MERLLNNISYEAYQYLINNNPDPIILFDITGNILDINSSASTTFGYTLEQFKETSFEGILTEDDLREARRNFIRVLDGGESCSFHINATTQEGHVLHFDVKHLPVSDKSEIIGVITVIRDVSELIKARSELQITLESLRKLFDSSADAMDIIDLNGNVLEVNPAFENMYGWTKEEVIGKPMPTIPKERKDDVSKRRKEVISGQNIKGLEVPCLKKDGSSIEVSITLSTIRNEKDEVVALLGISRDISEKKKLIEELKLSKDRYASLLHDAPEPYYVQSKGIIRYINDRGSKILGYKEPKELIGRNILEYVHEDSKSIAIERIHRSINEKIIPRETIEQRMLRKDGSSFIMEGTALGIDFKGEAAIQVIYRDISERKSIEEALIRSEEKYRLIADNMTDMVAIIEEDGIVNYVSPSIFTVLGFTPEDCEKKSAFDLVHPEDLRDVLLNFEKIFVTKETMVSEFRIKHKTKRWIWIEGKATFFIDEEHGNPFLLFVAYSTGKRKALQQKLESMAFHDELTGLPNRRMFQHKMAESIIEAKRQRRKLALLYMDIDKFKWVNDHLGHSIGDELLVQFGQRVSGCMRENDILARQGGDEFLVLLPYIDNQDSAITCAERIISSLQPQWNIGEYDFHTTSSIGIAIYPDNGTTMDELLTNADRALYKAKESGRNTYQLFK